jgi:phosphoribosylamine--glycine ligase
MSLPLLMKPELQWYLRVRDCSGTKSILIRLKGGSMNHETKEVMVIGSGGREDALIATLRESPFVGDIFVCPGNGGTSRFRDTYPIDLKPKNIPEVVEAAKDFRVDLVVVGPEDPLVAGLADDLRKEGIATFGPGKDGARLEGSKVYAVRFMERYGIPHPQSFISENYDTAAEFIKTSLWWENGGGIVVKADGLAAGKGVIVCNTREEAQEALEKIMVKKEFGDAGNSIVIQKKVKGFEVSAIAIVENGRYSLLPFSEDHKQLLDGDLGPNTGGMGVLAPHPLVDEALRRDIEKNVIKKTLIGLQDRKIDFRGVLYAGLMITPEGIQVLEYNVRFGDPETEGTFPLLEADLFPVLESAARGNLVFDGRLPIKRGHCLVLTLAAAGYPQTPEKGQVIHGLETAVGKDGLIVYHAGTKKDNGVIKTAGGRVLMVTGLGSTIPNVRDLVYGAIGPQGIHFDGMQFREDIGVRKRS